MMKPLVYGHRGTGGWDKKYAPEKYYAGILQSSGNGGGWY